MPAVLDQNSRATSFRADALGRLSAVSAALKARYWPFGEVGLDGLPWANLTRTGLGTRIGPTGLVEYGPHNLLLWSGDLSQAAWAASAGASKSGQTVVFGAGTGAFGVVEQQITGGSAAAGVYRFGVILSATGANIGKTVHIDFNGPSGNLAIVLTATPTFYGVTGSSWVGGFGTVRIISYSDDDATEVVFGGAGLVLTPASLGISADIVPTTTSARYLPRITYDPVTLASRGLLVEGAETNEVSTNLANWAPTAVNRTYNAAASPDGGTNAVNLVPTTANAFHFIDYSTATGANGQNRLARWYLKPNGYNFALIWLNTVNQGLMVNITTGATSSVVGGATVVENYMRPDGWRVISVLAVQSGASAPPAIYAFSTASVSTFAGDGTSGILVWQPKVSNSTALTSDIPNPGTGTAVRAADDWYLSGGALTDAFDTDAGTIVVQFYWQAGSGAVGGVFSLSDGGTSNIMYYNAAQNLFGVSKAGSPIYSNYVSPAEGLNTLAVSWSPTGYSSSLNGSATDESAIDPRISFTQFALGNLIAGVSPWALNNPIKSARSLKGQYTTGAALQALTA